MSYITKTNMTAGPYLGSQMTKYSGLYALSKRTGAEIVFIKEFLTKVTNLELFDAFDLPNKIINAAEAKFASFVLQDVLMDSRILSLDASQNWDIGGYFHTFQYFHEHRSDLVSIFTFKDSVATEALSRKEKIRDGEPYPLISLHVRRGDYLQVSSLNLGLSYYSDALKSVMNTFADSYFKLVVFSDDIEWSKTNFGSKSFTFVECKEGREPHEDIYLMSLCDHNIIANSSFSWWGALLNTNPNKIVIAPQRWFNDDKMQREAKDIVPNKWHKIQG